MQLLMNVFGFPKYDQAWLPEQGFIVNAFTVHIVLASKLFSCYCRPAVRFNPHCKAN